MARMTRAAAHLSLEEVKSRLHNDPHAWCRKRWLIIYNALVDPRKAEEIAKHCGVSKATVHHVISRYNRFGMSAVETPGTILRACSDRRDCHGSGNPAGF